MMDLFKVNHKDPRTMCLNVVQTSLLLTMNKYFYLPFQNIPEIFIRKNTSLISFHIVWKTIPANLFKFTNGNTRKRWNIIKAFSSVSIVNLGIIVKWSDIIPICSK